MHKLAYNSMISWANGWYFLIASEFITYNQIQYRLPGLGSYLSETMYSGDYSHAIFGVLVLVVIIVAFHLVVWGPLNDWSARFHLRLTRRRRSEIQTCGRLLRFHMARSKVRHAFVDSFSGR